MSNTSDSVPVRRRISRRYHGDLTAGESNCGRSVADEAPGKHSVDRHRLLRLRLLGLSALHYCCSRNIVGVKSENMIVSEWTAAKDFVVEM